MRTFRTAGLAAVAIVVVACDPTSPGPPAALTALPRALTTQEAAVISAANAFTLNSFREASAAEPGRNVFLSPLSASMSLGMTLNGARNDTFDAMRATLQFGTASQADINAGYQSIIGLLTGLDPTTEMRIANSIWFRSTFPIRPEFAAAGQEFFDAEVANLDFSSPSAVGTINNWVKEETNGRIPTILDAIDDGDQMFLINAIYFKGMWRTAFDPTDTKPAEFHAAIGVKQPVQMMRLNDKTLATASWPDGTASVELPYGNTAFNMMVILPPDTATLDAFVQRLTAERWGELMAAGSPQEMTLFFPRLKLEYQRELEPDLERLGMGVAFTTQADFSGMSSPVTPVLISSVLQKTFISIDEAGTEAAAVTKTVMSDSARPMMTCDRPYLIAIRERFSGTIVFIGKINSM
jgi:serine protease inhibitor